MSCFMRLAKRADLPKRRVSGFVLLTSWCACARPSVSMAGPVLCQGLAKCWPEAFAVLSPNIVRALARNDNGAAIAGALAVPLEQDSSALRLKLLNVRNKFIKHRVPCIRWA